VGKNPTLPQVIPFYTTLLTLPRIREFTWNQKINHFPASGELGNKERLSINIQEMKKIHSKKYPLKFNFLPKTYIVKKDWAQFLKD